MAYTGKLIEIKHTSGCEETAFYVPGIPTGRNIEYYDALDANGMPMSVRERIYCENCDQRVDLDAINDYYGEPGETPIIINHPIAQLSEEDVKGTNLNAD